MSMHISVRINSSICHTVRCRSSSLRMKTLAIVSEVNTSISLPKQCWPCTSSHPARNSHRHLHTFWTFITPLQCTATRQSCIRTANTFSAVKNRLHYSWVQTNVHSSNAARVWQRRTSNALHLLSQMRQKCATNHDVCVDAENIFGRLLEKLSREKYHHMKQLTAQTWMVNPFVIRQKKWFVVWQQRHCHV